MNTTVPPSPPQGNTPTPPIPAANGTGQVQTLPQSIVALLQAGQNLGGEVAHKQQQGQLLVQTPQGQVNIQTALPLPTGTAVILSLLGISGPPFTLNIQSLPHGHHPQVSLSTPTQGVHGQGQPTQDTQIGDSKPVIIQNLIKGETITATIVKGQTATPQQISQTPQPTSVPTELQAVQKTTPIQAALQVARDAITPSAPSTTVQTLTPTVGQVSQTPVSPPVNLPQGGTVPVKIIAIQLPNGQPLPTDQTSPNNLITGEVTRASTGQLQIQTNTGTLNLPIQNPPPVGTLILLSLEGIARPASNSIQPLTGQEMTQRWDGLRDALTLLAAGDAGAAHKVMQSMPQPSPKLGTSLLFFLNAVRAGNLESWLGQNNLQSLSRLSKVSADRVGNDFRMTQGRATDSAGSDWRSINIPMMTDGEIEKLRLYMKGYGDEDDNASGPEKKGKRFIIEVNFTKLGPFQFDGIAKDKTVDLMIRTHKPLEDGMRDDIRKLFIDTIDALGLTGNVGFHVSPKFDVFPISEDITYGGGVTV